MAAICQSVITALEELAPKRLAEKWDNVGLLVGRPELPVSGIVTALDVTPEVIDFAIASGANVLVAHHPVIFKGISAIRGDTRQGELLYKLIQQDIAVIAAHTNLDSAAGGVNDALANALSLTNIRPLLGAQPETLYKLAVYVPKNYLQAVRNAMGEAGAGNIGLYSHCSFSSAGEGTFKPSIAARPFDGQSGSLEKVDEYKLETCVTETLCRRVIAAMLTAHPYEEVAYDLYPIENSSQENKTGMGRLGILTAPMRLADFAALVKHRLSANSLKFSGNPDLLVFTAAVCSGSGSELIKPAKQAGADVYVTGDVKYHEAQYAEGLQLAIVDAGHFATEYPVIDRLKMYLQSCSEKQKWQISIHSAPGKDVFQTI